MHGLMKDFNGDVVKDPKGEPIDAPEGYIPCYYLVDVGPDAKMPAPMPSIDACRALLGEYQFIKNHPRMPLDVGIDHCKTTLEETRPYLGRVASRDCAIGLPHCLTNGRRGSDIRSDRPTGAERVFKIGIKFFRGAFVGILNPARGHRVGTG
jgi:hypothetical protein